MCEYVYILLYIFIIFIYFYGVQFPLIYFFVDYRGKKKCSITCR